MYYDPNTIHISNVSFGDAVAIIHDHLNNFEMNLD